MKKVLAEIATFPEAGDLWLQSLADVTSTAIFVLRDKILWANRGCELLSGYSRDELLEMSLEEIIHPDHRAPGGRAPEFGGIRQGRREIRIVRKNGSERWVDLSTGHVEVEAQQATVATAYDITERKLTELALTQSEERLNLAQRAARSLSWEWTPGTDDLTISAYADELLGFPISRMARSGEALNSFIHPDDRERLQRALRRSLKGGADLSTELRFLSPQGDIRWLAERAVAVRDDSGWTTKLIGVAQDITEHKIAEEALFQEKERAQVTLASIADGVIRTDAQGAVDYLNPVAQKLTGWTLAEAYGGSVDDIYQVVDPGTRKPLLNPVARCLREHRNVVYSGDRRLLHREGALSAINDSAAPIRNRQGSIIGAILVFKDMTPLRDVEQRMDHLASHDSLTGLINRAEFEGRLEGALLSAREEDCSHALCYIDLDQFKIVNDTCGHPAGDQMIQQIAALIGAEIPRQHELARLGGDEFGILLPDCTVAEARSALDGLVEIFRKYRFTWQDHIFSTGVSIGLVPIVTGSPEIDGLMSAADAACYVAKESGGNRVHEYEPGDTALAERYGEMQWISRIHQALDERRFLLYRQMIEPLTSGADEPAWWELFIRLQSKEGHLIGPEEFIPAAERYGLITTIDKWVIRTAFRELAEHEERFSDSRFAINLSGKSLGEEGFLDFVVEQFEQSGIEPGRIHFEITETAAIADLPHAMRFIGALKTMGCRFVLDDFGKGLSSFSYLKNLPVDYLKIDGEFVRDLSSDPIHQALVSSIQEIGRVMGLKTIAEWVEDAETVESLRRIGVDYVQGFYFSRPEPLGR